MTTTPEPFDTFSAQHTTTPIAVTVTDLGTFYLSTETELNRFLEDVVEPFIVFYLDRETGQWGQRLTLADLPVAPITLASLRP